MGKADAKPEKLQVNPGLLAALDHFSRPPQTVMQSATYFVHTTSRGRQVPWSVYDACQFAHKTLADERLNMLKLEVLKRGLKQHGMECLYERIVGEKLEVK